MCPPTPMWGLEGAFWEGIKMRNEKLYTFALTYYPIDEKKEGDWPQTSDTCESAGCDHEARRKVLVHCLTNGWFVKSLIRKSVDAERETE
jgi:hypothetical protein